MIGDITPVTFVECWRGTFLSRSRVWLARDRFWTTKLWWLTTSTGNGNTLPKPKLSRALANQVFQRDGWECRNCGRSSMLTPHHVIFRSRGGCHVLNNLLCLCM